MGGVSQPSLRTRRLIVRSVFAGRAQQLRLRVKIMGLVLIRTG
jgi:hypothetical protein